MRFLRTGLAKGGFFERFRMKSWDGDPTDVSYEGRAWYNRLKEHMMISFRKAGGIEVARVLDDRPKWVDMISDIDMSGISGNMSPTWTAFIGGIDAMLFDKDKMNVFRTNYHFNHNYRLGTAVYPHVHWSPASPDDTGVVRWGFELTIAKGHGQQAFGNTITLYVEQAADGVRGQHMVAEVETGWWDEAMEPDALILARVFRDGTHPNDTAGDVFAFTADIHHQIDDTGTMNRKPNFYS